MYFSFSYVSPLNSANWKERFLYPLLKNPPGQDGEVEGASVDDRKKRTFPPIRCIPSKMELVAAETIRDERLLHSVTVGSQEELVSSAQSDNR